MGNFEIRGKVTSKGDFLSSLPSYSVIITHEQNQVKFKADSDYFPRRRYEALKRDKWQWGGWTSEEELLGIFAYFVAQTNKILALKNLDSFCAEMKAAYAQKPLYCREEYSKFQQTLNNLKSLLGHTPDFQSKIVSLYRDTEKVRDKHEMYLGAFLDPENTSKEI